MLTYLSTNNEKMFIRKQLKRLNIVQLMLNSESTDLYVVYHFKLFDSKIHRYVIQYTRQTNQL